jgi:CRISPR-associated protein Csm1
MACPTCRKMFQLGGELLRAEKIVRSRNKTLSQNPICLDLKPDKVYYHLFEDQKNINLKEDTLFLINNWNLFDYQRSNTVPILLGNYGKGTEQEGEVGFMSASEFAEKSVGIDRVGYLRMDVDRLGQIFAKGLGENYSLPKLAGLSRQMSYFFKVYLNSLAEFRQENFINQHDTYGFKTLSNTDRKNLLFIYAGGDDLFISGSWNEVVEFAFDVYQSFRAYTGNNPNITLSGGINLEVSKFPLYQAASASGEAEKKAKGNDRDSLALFGEAFKWNEWLGKVSVDEIVAKTGGYLSSSDHTHPPFLGIWEFVCLLQTQNYNRRFIRNLLLTAQLQEQQAREKKDKLEKMPKDNQKDKEHDVEDTRYYLHLPKIAYTLARLSPEQRKHENFKEMRKSFLSPYNAPYFRAIATWIELLTRN